MKVKVKMKIFKLRKINNVFCGTELKWREGAWEGLGKGSERGWEGDGMLSGWLLRRWRRWR